MTSPRIEPATACSDQQLAALFTRGYEGYYTPIVLDAAAFRAMVVASDIDLASSRVVSTADGQVAFALLGVREVRGWIGGMGVVPGVRGRGLGRAVMEAVLSSAALLRLESVDLEVLERNAPAIPIYEALGFRDRRIVEVWVREPGSLPAAPAALPSVVDVPVAECLRRHASLHRVRPPWQRDLPALWHWADRLSACAVRSGDDFAAWVLYREDGKRLNIADAALPGGASPLALEAALRSILATHPDTTLTLVNLPVSDSAGEVLRRLGATVTMRQREMTRAGA